MNQFQAVGDSLDWARRIMRRHLAGDPLSLCPLKMAREALGLPEPEPLHRRRIGADGRITPAVPTNGTATAPIESPHALTPTEGLEAKEEAVRSSHGSATEEVIT